jgi:hypothetical protein
MQNDSASAEAVFLRFQRLEHFLINLYHTPQAAKKVAASLGLKMSAHALCSAVYRV